MPWSSRSTWKPSLTNWTSTPLWPGSISTPWWSAPRSAPLSRRPERASPARPSMWPAARGWAWTSGCSAGRIASCAAGVAATRRPAPARPGGGARLAMSRYVAPDRDVGLQGHYAGVCTRLVGFVFDVCHAGLSLCRLRPGDRIPGVHTAGNAVEHLGPARGVVGAAHRLGHLLLCLSRGSRRPHLRHGSCWPHVVADRTAAPSAAARRSCGSLALPLSFLTLGIGFLLILLRRDRRALQDLVGGTAVVYAWDARAARLRFLASRTATD